MDKAIADFFRANKVPIDRMVHIGTTRRGLSEASILEGARQVYEAVQNGAEIRPIRLAWEVYGRAEKVKMAVTAEEREARKKMLELHEWMSRPWWRRVFRRMKDANG